MGSASVIPFPRKAVQMRDYAATVRAKGNAMVTTGRGKNIEVGCWLRDFADLLEVEAEREIKGCIR